MSKKLLSPAQWLFQSALLFCAAVVLFWVAMQLLAQVWIAIVLVVLLVAGAIITRAVITARQNRW